MTPESLKEERIQQIYTRRNQGEQFVQIGKTFDISGSRVAQIFRKEVRRRQIKTPILVDEVVVDLENDDDGDAFCDDLDKLISEKEFGWYTQQRLVYLRKRYGKSDRNTKYMYADLLTQIIKLVRIRNRQREDLIHIRTTLTELLK